MAADTTAVSKFLVPVRLTHQDPIFSKSEMKAANQIDVWHKFILFNIDKADKNMVLDALIEACVPLIFFPVMYQMEAKDKATFLTMCKSNTIQKLVNNKMQVRLKSGKTIQYDIVLSFLSYKDMPMNAQQIISSAIRIRYNKEMNLRKILNLTNFINDKMLSSVYCPIHIPAIFDSILRFSKAALAPSSMRDTKLNVRDFILRANNMENLCFSEKVFNFHFTKLDVRDNKLNDINLLKPFSEYKITELWLDGNPFCTSYETAKDYVNAAKTIFPHLQILDGHVIGNEDKMIPVYHRHFIADKFKLNLIKQFLEHFFTCYDQDDRIILNGLYDTGAIFSMTVGQIMDNSHKNIIKSFAMNRNLLKFVDYAKCNEFLLYGPENIISALRREPPTLHKLKYIDIDLLFSTNNSFAISVQGPFLYRKHSATPMWFERTLIVVAKEDNEFCIINDQYHIDNCPENLNYPDLAELKFITDKPVPVFHPTMFSAAEKKQLLQLVQDLTCMNVEHASKLLCEANWDIRQAIKTFMSNYVNNKISTEAFK
ncbi:nuclear RNA export factor 1-like [Copidosoma floridanum]|uniref:nuclear RNA export factor 1-like n=1 Tax=Copidosoma floridanum TaxID=29053 RepID=UPI0006C9551A|nr:nuclear RNA export factor 1-like [Copidosoma floridanum]